MKFYGHHFYRFLLLRPNESEFREEFLEPFLSLISTFIFIKICLNQSVSVMLQCLKFVDIGFECLPLKSFALSLFAKSKTILYKMSKS